MASNDTSRLRRIQAIFLDALERTPEAERSAFLKAACGADQELLHEAMTLLEAHEQAGMFLNPGHLGKDGTTNETSLIEAPGTLIGRYKLAEKIGEGGMAVVYLAEQERPIRRQVALKVIKLGMDTKQVIARFEAERQALAMMDHQNIAKVFDGGATETGRPYFVMELVQGLSITAYCDQNGMTTRDRLALFIQVCHAVQHAHQKGIIHRDIKPSNVLVCRHDGNPLPKIIDFGIAKAINHRLTEKTLFTRYAHLVGTPAYMSPEQAQLSDCDIDTRTDIYSLGILLYELLTGTTPFADENIRQAGHLEMLRLIREQEPLKPSTKLGTLRDTGTRVAQERQVTPETLQRQLHGDLDWIVMTAMEKDRNRRYDAASALAVDVQHYLNREPVSARPPRLSYILGKYLYKHRLEVVTGLAIAVLLSAFLIVSLMWNHNRVQLSQAAAVTENAALSRARDAFARRDLSAALESIRPILDSAHVGTEARFLYAGILVEGMQAEEAVERLQELLTEKPAIAGAAHALLARVYWEGAFAESVKLAKVREHRQQAEALSPKKAEAYFLRALTELSIKDKTDLLDQALALDPGHYESRRLRAYIYQASRKYDLLEHDALVLTALSPQDASGYILHACACRRLGRYEEAIAQFDRALTLILDDSPQFIELYGRRCEVLMESGDYNRVVMEASEVLAESPDQAKLQFHLFCALTALGQFNRAEALYLQATNPHSEFSSQFDSWAKPYIFDVLHAGRLWHPPDREPRRAAFFPFLDIQTLYHKMSLKAERLIVDGFTAHGSPDGKRIAFSMGFFGFSGVALYDLETKETDLLIVPGKDPVWSPDGRTLAFVRDCQALPVTEFIGAERLSQHRDKKKEEVWIMNADGTEPRRLVSGSLPVWSCDATRLFYQSQSGDGLYSLSPEDFSAPARRVIKGRYDLPAVSPDEKYIASANNRTLVVAEVATQAVVEEWVSPFPIQGIVWDSNGRELCFGGHVAKGQFSGVWIYSLDTKQVRKVLDGPIYPKSHTPGQARLLMNVRPPFFEIWSAGLQSGVSLLQDLGPGKTMREHVLDQVDHYSQRIEMEPGNASHYYLRAKTYTRINESAKAQGDMERYKDMLAGKNRAPGMQFGTPRNLGSHLNTAAEEGHPLPILGERSLIFYRRNPEGPLDYWIAERDAPDAPWQNPDRMRFTEDTSVIPGITTADGLERYLHQRSAQYGSSDICVQTRVSPEARWGELKNLGPVVNSPATEMSPAISPDGLELYFSEFSSNRIRPGGLGEPDLWVTRRRSRDAAWTVPVNLGPAINTAFADCRPSLSADGLILFFDSMRPGGQGSFDLYMVRRVSLNAPWGTPVNLGPGVNTPDAEYYPHLSADGSTLYYESTQTGGYGDIDNWAVLVTFVDDDVDVKPDRTVIHTSRAVNLGPLINTPENECHTRISVDGLYLMFYNEHAREWKQSQRVTRNDPWETARPFVDSKETPFIPSFCTADQRECYSHQVPRQVGSRDLVMRKRARPDQDWGDWVNLGPVVNSTDAENAPAVSADGLELYFSGYSGSDARPWGQGSSDIWVTKRADRGSPWSAPVNLGPTVNSAANECRCCLSMDGRLLFFDSNRSGGYGGFDIWVTQRASTEHAWEKPVNLGPHVNSPDEEYYPYYLAVDATLYFNSGRIDGCGGHDIWKVTTDMQEGRLPAGN